MIIADRIGVGPVVIDAGLRAREFSALDRVVYAEIERVGRALGLVAGAAGALGDCRQLLRVLFERLSPAALLHQVLRPRAQAFEIDHCASFRLVPLSRPLARAV